MTEKQKDQYEVLEYVWHLAKKYDEEKEDVIQKFRDHINKILGVIEEEGVQDFEEYLSDLNEGLW